MSIPKIYFIATAVDNTPPPQTSGLSECKGGYPLTPAEVDQNFRNLQAAVESMGDFVVGINIRSYYAIQPGLKGYRVFPTNAKIIDWTLLSDQSGSIEIELLKGNYADFPTMTSITPINRIVVTNAFKGTGVPQPDWLTDIAAGEFIAFKVISSTMTRMMLDIRTQ